MASDRMQPPDALRQQVITDAKHIAPGLTPAHLMLLDGVPVVCLLDMGEKPLTAPFFDQDVEKRLAMNPGPMRAVVDIASFIDYSARAETVPATGFIFHTSRCGSTLSAQMLAQVDRHWVVSEPEIVNDVLLLGDDVLAPSERQRLLAAVIRGLGVRKGAPPDSHFFIKFSSWNILAREAIESAYPHVPWLFIYRDPIEVMVSVLRRACGWMRTKRNGGALLSFMGFRPQEVAQLDDTEYCAHVLGLFFNAALTQSPSMRALLAYPDLPDALLDIVRDHFKLTLSEIELTAMRHAASFDAKANSDTRFRSDVQRKRAQASPQVRDAADRFVNAMYQRLMQSQRH